MRSKCLVIGLALLLVGLSFGACKSDEEYQWWVKSYGGADHDGAWSIQETADGGYIVAGETSSFGAGSYDAWVLKLDPNGAVQWQKSYGGTDGDGAFSIQETSGGGYIVAGPTWSSGAGDADFWVLKLDSSGAVRWQKSYGGAGGDLPYSVQETSDGGYIMAGETSSFGAGDVDFWVLKLGSNGDVQWQKSYGGAKDDGAFSIQETSGGGYVAAGVTASFGAGDYDCWVLKLGSNGDVQWQRRYGGTNDDFAWFAQETADGGYIVAGDTWSFGAGSRDFWVLKLDPNGDVQWQRSYGGIDYDAIYSIQETADSGYIVAGETSSFGVGGDCWVLKLSSSGDVQWQKSYGGADDDVAWYSQETSDGGYIVAGETSSFGAGEMDFWVLKLDPNGDITGCSAIADSDAFIGDTSVTGVTTEASVTDTAVEAASTDIAPIDTDCTIRTQCGYP
jgi:hypothetical protein